MATQSINQPITGSGATGRVVIHTVDTTNTFVVVGNNSVSNLAVGSENVASAVITKVFWAGNVTIVRNAVTVFSAPTGTSGQWNLAADDVVINQQPTQNFTVTTAGGGMAIIEVKKKLVA